MSIKREVGTVASVKIRVVLERGYDGRRGIERGP